MVNRQHYLVLLFLCLCMGKFAQAASLTLSVSQDVIDINEFVDVQIVGIDLVGKPDTTPLERDFQIQARTEHQLRRQASDGSLQNRHVINLTLLPRRVGTLTIPALQAGSVTSAPRSLRVEGEAPSSRVIVEARLQADELFTQQQGVINVRILLPDDFSNPQLKEPKHDALRIVPITEQAKETRETRDGVRYRRFDLDYALFADQPGTYVIEPVVFSADILQKGSNARVFGRNFSAKSEPLSLVVKPPPTEASWWLPALSVGLAQRGESPKRVAVGEPISRDFTLRARGLQSAQLPPLATQSSERLKVYPGRAETQDLFDGNDALSERVEHWVYVPSAVGMVTLPKIEIPWWDIRANQQRKAVLPAVQVEVYAQPSTNSAEATAPTAPEPQATATENTAKTPQSESWVPKIEWKWLAILLAALVLVGALYWAWRRHARYQKTLKPRLIRALRRRRIEPLQDLFVRHSRAIQALDMPELSALESALFAEQMGSVDSAINDALSALQNSKSEDTKKAVHSVYLPPLA